MRILLISGRYPPLPCGIGDQTQRLATALVRRGHQVSIFTSRDTTARPCMTEEEGVQVFREAVSWSDDDRARIADVVQRQNVEIVHIQYHADAFHWHPMVTMLPLRLKKMFRPMKFRVVVTPHDLSGPIRFLPSLVRRVWLLPFLLFADGVVVTTERYYSLLRRLPLLHREPTYIPLGSSIAVYSNVDKQTVRKNLGVNKGDFFVVRFGFVHNVRASFIRQLLQAIRLLVNAGHPIKFFFIGSVEPKGREFVLSLAKSLGIGKHLLLTGYCPESEVSRYLSSADAAVQLYPDGVSGSRAALVTTLAHGLPTLAFRTGTVPSWLRHEENVLLVPSRKPSHLARALARLMSDPKLQKRLRANAPRGVAGWGKIADQTEELYKNLMETT